MRVIIFLLSVLFISSGFFINESFAEISENQSFFLEGSGFAVTEELIKTSEIDIALSSQQQSGSSINFLTENGFITLGEEEFIISELEGKFLREGRYIRINGDIESSTGLDTSISFFGRLVEESKDASVYGFTGRITTSDETYKIIYTTKLSTLSKITLTSESETSNNYTIHILRGSAAQGTDDTVPGFDAANYLRFFSDERISIEPGTTITIVNDDVVEHSIISGKENSGDRYNLFKSDGRISSGIILPGESINLSFNDAGFYRLYDPDYTWMNIVAYVFPNSDNLSFGTTNNQQGN